MNVFAKLIETKGKVIALVTGGVGGGGGMAGATLGDLMTGGTGLEWEEGSTGSDVVNVAKD